MVKFLRVVNSEGPTYFKAADLNLRNSLTGLEKLRTATATFVTLWDNMRTQDFQSDKVGTLRRFVLS
jgi:hypothetical protein